MKSWEYKTSWEEIQEKEEEESGLTPNWEPDFNN